MTQIEKKKKTQSDLASHNNRDISHKYTIDVRDKFDHLPEIHAPEAWRPIDESENFVNTQMEAATVWEPT